MVVTPLAPQAASMAFSVAPTLGRLREISAPVSRSPPRHSRLPPDCVTSAPSFFRAARWRSMGRGPNSQPPGILTSAPPVRASIAPRKMTDERISRISRSGMSCRVSTAAFTVTASPSRAT